MNTPLLGIRAEPSGGASLVLVACSQVKSPGATSAAELYTSDWFRKAKAYAMKRGERWAILSAKHGLVLPDAHLAPYDLALQTLSREERAAWGRRVLAQVDRLRLSDDLVVVLAGRAYRDPLSEGLADRFSEVEVPMAGMGILQQKAWLKAQVHGSSR